jgi:hypothetical protein
VSVEVIFGNERLGRTSSIYNNSFSFLSWTMVRKLNNPNALKETRHCRHINAKECSTYNWIWGIILFAHDPWNTCVERNGHVSCP